MEVGPNRGENLVTAVAETGAGTAYAWHSLGACQEVFPNYRYKCFHNFGNDHKKVFHRSI